MSTHHPEFHQCLPIQGFEHISGPRTTVIIIARLQWLHEWPRHSSLQNRRFMSQARRRRYFARSARRGEGRRKKKRACCQSIVLALPTFTVWNLRSNWLIDDALFWHVCLEQNIGHAFMFFWRCCSRSLSFISECSRNKRKPQEMFNLPYWAINYRNWFYPRSYFLCCYRCFW